MSVLGYGLVATHVGKFSGCSIQSLCLMSFSVKVSANALRLASSGACEKIDDFNKNVPYPQNS